MSNFLRRFTRTESFSGLLVICAAAIAVLWANITPGYIAFWSTEVSARVGSKMLTMDVEHLIGEVAMSAFFLVVGLEIRRELASGHLTSRLSRVAPIVAALAGTVIPAAIYLALALPEDRIGWPIPTATDIALVIGIYGLLATRLHPATRVLLLSIAVLDDVIGIGLLAILSTGTIQPTPIIASGIITALTAWLTRKREIPIIALLGLWLVLLVLLTNGGLHPTLSGILVALAAPSRRPTKSLQNQVVDKNINVFESEGAEGNVSSIVVTPVERLELALLPWVSYLILPLFVLSHTGVTLENANRTTLAVAIALAIGKPIALIGSLLIGQKIRILTIGDEIATRDIIVIGLLCGGGLTVSSLLASAALTNAGPAILGVLIGSTFAIIAAVIAACVPHRRSVNQ